VWNKLDSPDRIMVGQRLRLWPPGSSGFATAAMQPVVATTAAPEPALEPELAAEAAPAPSVRSKSPQPGRKGWDWPAQGKVVSGFNPSVPGRNGIRISGREGQVVKAAFPGQIVYTGSSLPGYGTLIIVQHSGGLLSAYGYLGKLYVKEGDKVEKGQTIAELGAGNDNRAALHFEIRKDGQPVNPLRYLPS
jgi:lipoprotein NlpD